MFKYILKIKSNVKSMLGDIKTVDRFNFEFLGLILLILLIPVMLNVAERPTFPLFLRGKIQLSEIASIILFLAWFKKIFTKERRLYFKFLYIPLIMYIGFSLISIKNSVNIMESVIEFMGVLYLSVLFIILSDILYTKKNFFFTINLWIFTSVIVVFLGFTGILLAYLFNFRTFFIREYTAFPFLGHIYRIHSTFLPNAKFLSSYLTIGIPLVFLKIIFSITTKEKLIWINCLGLFFITLFFTFSRGWLSLAICLYLILLKIDNLGLSVKFFKYFLLIFIIFFGIFIFLASIWEPVDITFRHFYDKESQIAVRGAMVNPSLGLKRIHIGFGLMETHYFILKKKLIEVVKERPFIGIGLGTFKDKLIHMKNTAQLPGNFPVLDPHCTILGRAAETGMLGVVTLIFFWGYMLRHVWQTYKAAVDKKDKLIIWSIFSIIIAFALQSIDMDIMNFRFLWFLFALSIASRTLINNSSGTKYLNKNRGEKSDQQKY